MNGESGFDSISLFRKAGIKVLVYSMFASPSYVVRSSELGANGYISKSASESELIEALDKIFSGKSYIQKGLVPELMFTTNILSSLTNAEKKLLDLVSQDLKNSEIDAILKISVRTVENHLSYIYDKFRVQNKRQLLRELKKK